MEDSLKAVIMERDGLEEDEAEHKIDEFRSELTAVLDELKVNENVIEVLESAKELMADHFGLEPDYLDEFIMEEIDF